MMNQIKCEMCGSNDLIKENGVFVCQYCGCKYSLEEARKLMGVVKVDKSDEEDNFIELAKAAMDSRNGEQALSYAEKALEINAKNVKAWMLKMYSMELLGTDISKVGRYSGCGHQSNRIFK